MWRLYAIKVMPERASFVALKMLKVRFHAAI